MTTMSGPAPARSGAGRPERSAGVGRSAVGRLAPADARALSKPMFRRLAELEPGSYEYHYVRDTLVELNLALVKFAAARFRGRSEPMEDIVQVGMIGLIKAIDRFDVDRECEFPTFAMPTVLGEIRRFFRDTSWTVHVPRRLQELRLRLAKAGDELSQELGRPATDRELAARLGLTEEEVREGVLAANAYTVGSLDAHTQDDGEDGHAILERRGEPDPALAAVDDLATLKPLMDTLSQRERDIIRLRFGADLTQSQIGAELGISQMHVSRLLARALGRLREHLLLEE
ncbi:SigB/SigF/SigG family RNA polymerase sigma factor [Streptacidiphilus cavernicola]|uniref:SigB/SigF/SigG family RNA polymerase sigma factor n=1 Tax=Streptacidiphilus cavernicola TaxID=3342716 RepID=A0ABV6W081_9ACTN